MSCQLVAAVGVLRIKKIATAQPEYTALSLTQRAHRIAEHYLEDPGSWAAADLKGKGITACLAKVDPAFPGDMMLVYRAVKALLENYCPVRTIEFHLDMLIFWAHLTKGQKITACSQ